MEGAAALMPTIEAQTRWSGLSSAEAIVGDSTSEKQPKLKQRREGAAATLLWNGKVLIAGGKATDFPSSAELYQP